MFHLRNRSESQYLLRQCMTLLRGLSKLGSTDSVSNTTVRKRLLKAQLRGCVATWKPLLCPQNKLKRLQWAKTHGGWGSEAWQKCLYTDESKFELFSHKRRVFVRRCPNERRCRYVSAAQFWQTS